MATPGNNSVELLVKVIDDATSQLRTIRKEMGGLEEPAKKTNTAFAALSKSFLGIASGAAALALLTSAFRKTITETSAAQAAIAQLDAALESSGNNVGLTSQQLQDYAGQLQRVTQFSDDAVISAQSLLLGFENIRGDNFIRTTQAVVDLAARLGKDLNSAAILVGRALNDPVDSLNALSRSGIKFTDSQRQVIKSLVESGRLAEAQTIILDALEKKFDGAAIAAGDTLGGALSKLNNAFGDLFEVSNKSTAEAVGSINKLTTALSDPRTKDAVNTLTSLFFNLAAAIVKAGVEFVNFLSALAVVKVGAQVVKSISGTGGAATASANAPTGARGPAARGAAASIAPVISEERQKAVTAAIKESLSAQDQQRANIREQIAILTSFVNVYSKFNAEQLQSAGVTANQIQSANAAIGRLRQQLGQVGGEERKKSAADAARIAAEAARVREGILSAGIAAIQSVETPTERVNRQFEEIRVTLEALAKQFPEFATQAEEALARAGVIAVDTLADIGRVAQETTQQTEQPFSQLTVFAEQAARNIQSAFANFLFDPFKEGLRGLLKGFVDLLRRMVAELLAQAALLAFLDWLSGGTGTIARLAATAKESIKGGRAMGGPVSGGSSYLVGERGPEIFTPGASGIITPNNRIGGSVTVAPVYNIDARGATQDLVKALPAILEDNTRRAVALARATIYDDFSRGAFGRT